jgi:hypothetical protein
MNRRLFAVVVTIILALTFLASTALAGIPEDAVEFNGHSYKLFTKGTSWKSAKKACEKLGGHLVSITSAEEQAFVFQQAKNYKGKQFWIGLTDEGNEGDWHWITGEAVTYTNWGKGNPNDDGGQDYGVLYTTKEQWDNSGVKPGQWDDDAGKGPNYYICEWDSIDDSYFTVDGIKYKLDPGTLTASACSAQNKSASKITIPAQIQKEDTIYQVTGINKSAFAGMSKLTTVTIGTNVESIGAGAFENCGKLKTITVETAKLTAKQIGKNACSGISAKATFKVPAEMLKNYQKWFTAKGAPATSKFKKI